MLWACAVVVIYGVSLGWLKNLQGPLTSLNVAAHVIYRMSHVHDAVIDLAFAESYADNDRFKAELRPELALMAAEYNTLLYGGQSNVQVCILSSAD